MRAIVRLLTAVLALSAAPAGALRAEPLVPAARHTLGYGHLFNNDEMGDGHDRWQTGSWSLSVLRGRAWSGALPSAPFEVMEYRFEGAIITPWGLRAPLPSERRYVARLEVSARTHFDFHGLESALGLGLVTVGPQTGLSDLQASLHEIFDATAPEAAANQLPDHVWPVATAEIAHSFDLARGVELRPFLAARAGDETLARIGFDLSLGPREHGALWLRDRVSGQRYIGISGQDAPRATLLLGGDIAHVFDSRYFPDPGVSPRSTRKRLRLGLRVAGGGLGVFYGLTWLSEEFTTQPEGQLIGSLRVRMQF